MTSKVIEPQKKEQKADENFIANELLKKSWYILRSQTKGRETAWY